MTIELDQQKARFFLAKNSLENGEIKKITSDASFRSYYRVFNKEKTFILMFAPPGYEDVRPFSKIAEFLIKNNFSAPKIFARDEQNGFLLLEDFGDNTYSRALKDVPTNQQKNLELDLYRKACDCLIRLHKLPLIELPTYNHAMLFREVMLFVDWYLPLQKLSMTSKEKAHFKFLWLQLFDLLNKENHVVVLRDYHADNLMILSSKDSYQKVGLLDFQDAVIGPNSYDLVSLLEDARRDIDQENRAKIFNYYLESKSSNEAEFIQNYKILSLQRNLKILGIFSRLSVRDGKDHYLKLLPRVLDFVKLRLSSEDQIFSEIRELIKKFIL